MTELVCRKCGHRAAYHGMTWCKHHPGGTQRRECDCDGWEAAASAEPQDSATALPHAPAGLDVERLARALHMLAALDSESALSDYDDDDKAHFREEAEAIAAAYAEGEPR